MSGHSSLSPERWARFSSEQQILMIANEMERGRADLRADRGAARRLCYARVLDLVDLTLQGQPTPGMRRELLHWRGVIAGLDAAPDADKSTHELALRVLLELTGGSAAQVPLLGL